MKKRKCRQTDEERLLHERAVKIRKMTDAQMCSYIDSLSAAPAAQYPSIEGFLESLSSVPGVGPTTINKLREHAAEKGWMD